MRFSVSLFIVFGAGGGAPRALVLGRSIQGFGAEKGASRALGLRRRIQGFGAEEEQGFGAGEEHPGLWC